MGSPFERRALVSQEEFLEAIINSRANIGYIAEQTGYTRETVRKRIRDEPVLNDAYSEVYESVMSLAEDRLFEAIDKGEPWAIKLYLTTKGAAKGYGLKMENTGGPIIVFNWNEMEAPAVPDIRVIDAKSLAGPANDTD